MKSPTLLEDLPNELLEEIFDHMRLSDVFYTFYHLNRRFHQLSINLQHYKFVSYSPEDTIDPYLMNFPLKISTLVVAHSKRLILPFNYQNFVNVEHLILRNPTREQWNQIDRHNFPNLKTLHLVDSVFTYRTEHLCCVVFSNEFPFLTKCSLPFVADASVSLWKTSSSLTSVTAAFWDLSVFYQILKSCPNLIYFKIRIKGNYDQQSLVSSPLRQKHIGLRYFVLRPSKSIKLNVIDAFLHVLPKLEYFSLKSNDLQGSSISPAVLASILEQRTPELRRVRIDLTLNKTVCDSSFHPINFYLFKRFDLYREEHKPPRLIINQQCWNNFLSFQIFQTRE